MFVSSLPFFIFVRVGDDSCFCAVVAVWLEMIRVCVRIRVLNPQVFVLELGF